MLKFLKGLGKVLLTTTLLVSSEVNSQSNDKSIEYVKGFIESQQKMPRERVYIHTDRNWYFPEDRIWFSAYVTAGGNNYLSEISSVLYVELISPDGEVISRVNVELTEGRGQGSFTFEGSKKKPGVYQVNAYTLWGTNFGDDYTFSKRITVLGEDGKQQQAEASGVIDLQFLPEGGVMVYGVPSRLAFKAIGVDGKGWEVNGTIYDDTNEVVKSFESQHQGMGAINFIPEPGKKYYAIANGQRFELPVAQARGLTLSVESKGDGFEVTISSDGIDSDEYLLFGHVRGVVYHAEKITVGGNSVSVTIPKEKFSTGIVSFTLLDNEGSPIRERLIFNKNPLDKLRISLDSEVDVAGLRARQDYQVTIQDWEGASVSGTASVSVFDDHIYPYTTDQGRMYEHLYLSAELSGYIEEAGYYFSGAEKAEEHLDLLMLTQGWRGYTTRAMDSGLTPETIKAPEQGFTISGTIRRPILRRAVKNAPVLIQVGIEDPEIYSTVTDEDGRFILSDVKVTDGEVITLKASDEKGGNRLTITLDEQFGNLPVWSQPILQSMVSPTKKIFESPTTSEEKSVARAQERSEETREVIDELIDFQLEGELAELTVTADAALTRSYLDQEENQLTGRGAYLNILDEPELLNLSVEQVLNRMQGVQVISLLGGKTITVDTGFQSIGSGRAPSPIFVLDGTRVPQETILALNLREIETVSVLRSAIDLAVFGSEGAGGAIIISTRSGFQDFDNSGTDQAKMKGFQQEMTFYSPKYGVTVPQDLEREDNRITLHWEPKLALANGTGNLRFWTNDIPSTYRVVVEGITDTGVPFYTTKTFRVSQ